MHDQFFWFGSHYYITFAVAIWKPLQSSCKPWPLAYCFCLKIINQKITVQVHSILHLACLRTWQKNNLLDSNKQSPYGQRQNMRHQIISVTRIILLKIHNNLWSVKLLNMGAKIQYYSIG